MWDERYSSSEYVYGREPNAFLAESVDSLPKGEVLCLAEGEGRNAVFLASQGYRVCAVDSSAVGLEKAQRLARSQGVCITTEVADLADYPIRPGAWDAIVSIFCHLPAAVRSALHRQVVAGLRPGGIFVLEAYTPQQLEFGTGGPPVEALMMSLEVLREELAGLEFLYAQECIRPVIEGCLHTGDGAVVELIARKP